MQETRKPQKEEKRSLEKKDTENMEMKKPEEQAKPKKKKIPAPRMAPCRLLSLILQAKKRAENVSRPLFQADYFLIPNFSIKARYLSISVFFK